MTEIKRYHEFKNGVEENEHGMFVKHDDLAAIVAALQAESDSNLKSAQYSAETNRKVVKKNIELQGTIDALQEQVRALEHEKYNLTQYKASYVEWQDKTEWVQGDKRFDVLLPWGKHRADVLKDYVERVEGQLKDEFSRRDAAAGEPVAYQIHSDLEGWRECTPERYTEVFSRPLVEGKHSGGWLVRKLHTAAQPAVLPPKLSMDIDPEIQGEFRVHEAIRRKGFNQALDAALALGAQQQNVVELYKRKSMEVISGQRYSYVLLEDLLPELDAANVKWEVKK